MTDLGLFAYSLVDNVVVLDHLLFDGIRQVLHASIPLLQVDVTQAAVEKYLARVQLEQKPQLGIVDHGVAAQVQQGVVEVGERLLEIAEQEVGNALLEVCDSKILVESNRALVAFNLTKRNERQQTIHFSSAPTTARTWWTYRLLVLAESGVDDAHVEEDLARVADLVELAERIIELIVVVAGQGRNPGFDFLQSRVG